jgi:hypothetical protein
MKKQPVFVSFFLIVAILILAIPSVASARSELVGERILVFYDGSTEFPEGTPFHIFHGWVQASDSEAIGIFDFELEIDGVLQSTGFKMFSVDAGNPDTLWRLWAYNFPEGMTGTHTFTGHWYAPCQNAVDWLGYPGACATPNAKVETNTRTLVVNFVPSP